MLARRTRCSRDVMDASRRQQTSRAFNNKSTICFKNKPTGIFVPWFEYILVMLLQKDMLSAMSRQKATVNEEDLQKCRKFTEDFGQDG